MAPVILGFDLGEMSWSAFSHRSMFTRKYTLRRERFVVYQLAMVICLAAECTATYSLAKYQYLQENFESYARDTFGLLDAELHNDDLIAAECLTIVFCVFVATLFGADFFFLLFFPKRTYPKWYNVTKKALAIGITLGVFAAALMSTIIVASHSAFIGNVSPEVSQVLLDVYNRPPLQYNKWAVNVAYVVVLWVGLVFVVASTALMLIAADHDERSGSPESRSYVRRKSEKDASRLRAAPPAVVAGNGGISPNGTAVDSDVSGLIEGRRGANKQTV